MPSFSFEGIVRQRETLTFGKRFRTGRNNFERDIGEEQLTSRQNWGRIVVTN